MQQYILIVFIAVTGLMAPAKVISNQPLKKENGIWEEKFRPEVVAKKVIDNFFASDQIKLYQTDFLNTIHYSEACMVEGIARWACLGGDTLLFRKIEERYRGFLNHFDTLADNHVDANVIGLIPLKLYYWNKDSSYRQVGITMANTQWEKPLPNGISNQTRYWIDDLYMIGILQIEAWKVAGEAVYLERAAKQFDAYLRKLQQGNGLFYHGPEAPFFWGRGNGWVVVALAEMITVLPPENRYYSSILNSYLRMVDVLISFQLPNGMWRQLIDVEEAWEESSATAMFGYAIHRGIVKGLLKHEKYTSSCHLAWRALTGKLTEDGKLTGICAGTGQSKEMKYYLERPVITGDLHGQAPLLWFACSLTEEKNLFDR